MERHQETRIAAAPASELDPLLPEDPLERALASARAPGADGGARRAVVDRLATLDLGDPRATADRLQQLLTDHALRDGLGAKAQVRGGEFSWSQTADAMRSVLESVAVGATVAGVV